MALNNEKTCGLKSLAGLSLTEIKDYLTFLPPFRSGQIYNWILMGADNFDQMTDIPLILRNELKEQFSIYSSYVETCHEDSANKKIILSLYDGLKIEAVLLCDKNNRFTACISTQAGCPCGCVFCKTGSTGFKRNLESYEIVEQFLHLLFFSKNKYEYLIDNIVVMGMGEPLLNLINLKKALEIINDKKGINFSRRRITVSTCGICEGIIGITNNLPFAKLALSLTTGDEQLRQKLMPVSLQNPLKSIKQALMLFQQKGGGRITLEVTLLGGINTRDKDAKSIKQFAKGLDYVINIIPWNPVKSLMFEGLPIRESTQKETNNFIDILKSYGLKVTKRQHRGRSIMGACGQLG